MIFELIEIIQEKSNKKKTYVIQMVYILIYSIFREYLMNIMFCLG